MMKLGLFGVGHLGKFHLNNWQTIDGIEITGFYDPHDGNAAEVAAKYGIERYTSAEALMQQIDIADIVAPTDQHFSLAGMAIRNGRHVFIEKPLANTMAEAKELLAMAREASVKIQVGHVERFNPAFQALKEVNVQPMFIEVHRLAQFNPRGTEVSVILDLMIHDIDIILSIVQSDVKQISASGVAVITETPDIANVRIEFNNGCVANLTSSRISMKKMRKMRLFQKDAYIGIDFLEKKTEIIRLEQSEDKDAFVFDLETPSGNRRIAVSSPPVHNGNAILAELQSFVKSINENTTPVVSEIDGYLAMEVAHKILEKIQHGGSSQRSNRQ